MFLLKLPVVQLNFPYPQDVFEALDQIAVVEWLEDIFGCAVFHQLDSDLFTPLSGKHDHISSRIAGLDLLQCSQSVHLRHHIVK